MKQSTSWCSSKGFSRGLRKNCGKIMCMDTHNRNSVLSSTMKERTKSSERDIDDKTMEDIPRESSDRIEIDWEAVERLSIRYFKNSTWGHSWGKTDEK